MCGLKSQDEYLLELELSDLTSDRAAFMISEPLSELMSSSAKDCPRGAILFPFDFIL